MARPLKSSICFGFGEASANLGLTPDEATNPCLRGALPYPNAPAATGGALSLGARGRQGPGAQAHQMANRKHEIRAVHGVEVQFLNAMIDEIDHLLGAHGRRDQAACRGIVFEAVKSIGEPLRHARPGSAGEIGGLLEVLHRKDAGHDRNVKAGRRGDVEKAKVSRVIEEKLGDGARGAPASTFCLRISMSCSNVGLCGWRSG